MAGITPRHFSLMDPVPMAEKLSFNLNWAPTPAAPTDSPAVAEKKAQLEATAIQKKAMFGTPQEQQRIATADLQGNRLADDQSLQDLKTMQPDELLRVYGKDAWLGRGNYLDARRGVEVLKESERDWDQVAGDSLIDTGKMAANVVGGVAALGTAGVDAVLGTTMSPVVSEATQDLSGWLEGQQSQLMQDRRAQHQIEASLDKEDREARYQEALAAEAAGEWDGLLSPGATKFVEGFGETIANYADDPIMAGSLVPEGIGSLLPTTLGIKVLAKANTLRMLTAGGMTRAAAVEHLGTEAGKKLLEQTALKLAPVAIGATETGGAVSQVQNEIMNLSEEEMWESEEYQALRAQNMSHREAQLQIATDAGIVAAPLAAPGALLAGKIAAPFAANPFRIAPNNAIRAGVQDITRETVEETLQEMNSAVVGNIAKRDVGFDQALEEGVAEAGAQGALGGIASAGSMQAPGIAADILGQSASAVGNAVLSGASTALGAAGTKLDARNEAKLDAESVTGTKARVEAAAELASAGAAMVALKAEQQASALPSPSAEVVEDQAPEGGVSLPASDPAEDDLRRGLVFDEDEIANVAANYPSVKAMYEADPKASIPRTMVVEEAARAMASPDEATRIYSALDVLDGIDSMKRGDSTRVREAVAKLPANDTRVQSHKTLTKHLATFEQSKLVNEANKILSEVTPEILGQMVPASELAKPDLDPKTRESYLKILDYVAQANPALLSKETYDTVLNQLGPVEGQSPVTAERRKHLSAAAKIFATLEKLDAQKAKIWSQPGTQPPKTKDEVRKEIFHTGMDTVRNGEEVTSLSLSGHYKRVNDAMRVGHRDVAMRALTDLRNFALSQSNKMKAFNESAAVGKGKSHKVPFVAKGVYGFYAKEAKDGVWVDLTNPNSVALAQEVHADATAAADLLKQLIQTHGLTEMKAVSVPNMHKKLTLRGDLAKPVPDAPKAQEPVEPKADPMMDPLIDAVNRKVAERKAERAAQAKTTKEEAEAKAAEKAAAKAAKAKEREEKKAVRAAEKKRLAAERRAKAAAAREPKVQKRPFTAYMARIGGIAPHGPVARELRHNGVTPRTTPGLFRKTGYTDLDNIPAREHPDLAWVLPVDDSSGYFEQQGLIDAIVSEAAGTPLVFGDEAIAQAERQEFLEAEADAARSEQEETTETAVDQDIEEISSEAAPVEDAPVVRWFESLKNILVIPMKGVNVFLDAFKPRKHGSLLPGIEDAHKFFEDYVRSSEDVTEEQRDAIDNVMEMNFTEFSAELDNAAQEFIKGWNLQGEAISAWLNTSDGLPLNLLKEGSVREFPEQVKFAAFAAVYEWLLASTGPQRPRDEEAMAKILGLPRGTSLPGNVTKAVRYGHPQQSAVEQIANKMMVLLDVSPRDEKTIRQTQGMFRSLAATSLELLMDTKAGKPEEGRGRIGWRKVHVTVGDVTRDFIMLEPHVDQLLDRDFEVLVKMRSPFTNILTQGRVKDRLIGKPLKTVARTQLGNRLAELSRQERKVVKRLQETPNRLVKPMVNFFQALGDENVKTLLGFQEISEADRKTYNVDHLDAIDGKNNTIEHDLAAVQGYIDEVSQVAETQDGIWDMPIFFEWAVSAVGRLQQSGPVTPQGSKIAREMISSTHSTLDLDNAKHEEALWLAIAQSLGVKVEQKSVQDSIESAQDLVTGKYAPLIDLLAEGIVEDSFDVNDFMETVAAKKLGPLTPKQIHALMVAAQVEVADVVGNRNAFETALALEADGKTDGPINAMVHMGLGEFDAAQIERFAKGGLFFTDVEISLNNFVAMRAENRTDLYHMAAHRLEARMHDLVHGQVDDVPEGFSQERLHSVLRVLEKFNDPAFLQIELEHGEDGRLEGVGIGRNTVKNPLTVFLYGSGVNGVSNKIAGVVTKQLSKMLTEISRQGNGYRNFDALKANEYQMVQDLMAVMGLSRREMHDWFSNPVESTVSGRMFDTLAKNIEIHFAQPMFDAIDETTGGLGSHMRTTQRASQVQALIFRDVFLRKLKEAQAEEDAAQKAEAELEAKRKGSNGATGEWTPKPGRRLLSEERMRDIYAESMKIAPIYGTDAQSFQIAAPDRDQSHDYKVGGSFSGNMETRATLVTPADASVKVSAFLTIGTGDGRMILNIYHDGNGDFDMSLPVFDGVELAADKIEGASRQINEQVYNGWIEGNPYQAIADGFRQMTQNLTYQDFANLSKDTKDALNKTMRDFRKTVGNRPLQHADIVNMQRELDEMAMQSTARKRAMARMATSTDHMASAQAPFVSPGTVVAGGSPIAYDEITSQLNQLYREELSALQAQARAAKDGASRKDYAQKPSAEFRAKVSELGTEVDGHPGVVSIKGSAVMQLLTADTDTTEEQLRAIQGMRKVAPLSEDVVYYFGSNKALEQVRNTLYPELTKGLNQSNGQIQYGQSSAGKQVVFVAHAAPEVLIHEMLHIHTMKRLVDFYDDPRSVPEHVRHAVKELEALRDDILKMVPEGASAGAMSQLHAVLHAQKGNPAAQISELISYALSNQKLSEKLEATKTYRPLISWVARAINAFKKLVGFHPGNTLLSNLQFNATLLVAPSKAVEVARADAQVNQVLDQSFPASDRLQEVEEMFLGRMRLWLERMGNVNDLLAAGKITEAEAATKAQTAVADSLSTAGKARERAAAAGFNVTAREARAFEAVYASVQAGMRADKPIHRHLQEAFDHVLRVVTPQDFTKLPGVSASLAEAMWDHLAGADGIKKQTPNRNDQLAVFTALALTNDGFREVLEKIEAPKIADLKWDSVDDFLRSIGSTLVNLITRLSIHPRKMEPNLRQEMEKLALTLTTVQGKRRLMAGLETMNEKIEQANSWLASQVEDKSTKATIKLVNAAKQRKGSVLGQAAYVTSLVTSLGSPDRTEENMDNATYFLNRIEGKHELRSILSDLRGQTKDNIGLLRLINKAKSKIDALRQDFREGVPVNLAKKFSRPLTSAEWSQLHKGLARTDLLALGHAETLDLLRNLGSLDQKIADAEEAVMGLGGAVSARQIAKAKALAVYMVSGKVTSQNLLPNAHAIAHLFGENKPKGVAPVSEDLVTAIDQLTSLYAFAELDADTQKALADLAKDEADGMQTLTGFLNGTRTLEMKRITRDGALNQVAQNNGLKGYIPRLMQEGAALMVFEDDQQANLLKRGFTRVGDYVGDKNEGRQPKRGYYRSTVAGKTAFRQGVAQTVHETWMGVDAHTGQRLPGQTAGLIADYDSADIALSVGRARPGSLDNLPAGDYLLPIFDKEGKIAGHQRPMDPAHTEAMPMDDHLGRMLGVWMGRIVEENVADANNVALLEVLKETYDAARAKGDVSEFINVADPNQKDPVVRDAWGTMGWKMKQHAHEVFGKDELWVKRDQVEDAIGFRRASTTDAWTGISRWNEKTQQNIQKTAERLLGVHAFRKLKTFENTVESVVSFAKTTIIVRSIVVGYQNILSNIYHLSMVGVSPIAIATGMRDKFSEISTYVKNREEIQRLQIEMAAVINNPTRRDALQARIAVLDRANAKLSVAPLIESGEFSTISESLTEADVAIREGKWGEYLERVANRMPDWAQGTAKNLLITKDSALFQGLNRMVQYGDFVAKAVLYDHLTKKKGMKPEDALDQIREEFVQYNRLPGRGRDFRETMGLQWFWSYKLRIMKIAARTLRDRPLTSLFMMGGVGPASGISTTWDGSFLGSTLDGRLPYSFGPAMGFDAPFNHPVAAIFD
jgi:hypothetical protein